MSAHDELVMKVKSVIEDYEHMIGYDPYILYEKVAEFIEKEIEGEVKE